MEDGPARRKVKTKTRRVAIVVAAVLVVAIAGISAGSYFGILNVGSGQTCIISGPTIGAVVRVVSEGTPVSGAVLSGRDEGFCGQPRLPQVTTNSSGWAPMLDGGSGGYDITVSYAGSHYDLSISVHPLAATYAVFDLSSGDVTTYICYYNENCLAQLG